MKPVVCIIVDIISLPQSRGHNLKYILYLQRLKWWNYAFSYVLLKDGPYAWLYIYTSLFTKMVASREKRKKIHI